MGTNLICQTDTHTQYDRYPDVFNSAKQYIPKASKILSFGCSSGEECFTLKEKYFPLSRIIGVDLNKEKLSMAKSKNVYNDVFFFDSIEQVSGLVDIIFAMSVLCKWPNTENLTYNNCFSFDDFENNGYI